MKNLSALSVLLVAFVLHAQATKHVISAAGISFSPNDIPNVLVGDTVRWEWDNGDHTTTSVNVPAGAATWNSPLNTTTRLFEYPVTVAGEYSYRCIPHGSMGMTGTFTATGPSACDSLVCNDNDACTTDTCTNNNCVFTPIVCDDANPCTTDTCDNGVCAFTPIVGCNVGIREISDANLRVFPNPASDKITIDGMHEMLTRILLMDVSGKQVYDSGEINSASHSIHASTLPEGVYLLHIYTAEGEAVGKVVVKR